MKKIFAYIALFALAFSAQAAERVLVLRSSASLYEATDGENVKWAKEVTAGTVLEAKSADEVQKNIVTKEKTWEGVKCYAVTHEKKSYFIQTRDSAALGNEQISYPAVIYENAVLFSKPHVAAFRNAWLEPGTIVAVLHEDPVFDKIAFFDTQDGVKRTRYVFSGFSLEESDIKAVQLLEKARGIKDADLQKEFLENAEKTVTSEALAAYITAEKNKILGISDFDAGEILELDEAFWATVYTADGSKVNVRKSPGTKGEVETQLNTGAEVFAVKMTEEQDTIDGISDYWYEVGLPDEAGNGFAWIFGGYLKRGE